MTVVDARARTNATVIVRLDRTIQYAAASRFNYCCSGILGRRLRGDDEWWAYHEQENDRDLQ
jgi:hypothetical protein